MKTLEEYRSGQPIIATKFDINFTHESLINKIPSTAIMQLLHEVNKLEFTDGFSIKAMAEIDEAMCDGANHYKVLVSVGYAGESQLAQWNPTKHYIFTFENKDSRVVNVDFDFYTGEFVCKDYMDFLQEFSEYKIYLK